MKTLDDVRKHNKRNFSFTGKEIETKRKVRIKIIDIENEEVVAENKEGELKKYNFSQIRIFAYTRMRDINKRKIYEGSYVGITRKTGEKFEGITVFRKGWGILTKDTEKFKKFLKSDKIEKLIKQ